MTQATPCSCLAARLEMPSTRSRACRRNDDSRPLLARRARSGSGTATHSLRRPVTAHGDSPRPRQPHLHRHSLQGRGRPTRAQKGRGVRPGGHKTCTTTDAGHLMQSLLVHSCWPTPLQRPPRAGRPRRPRPPRLRARARRADAAPPSALWRCACAWARLSSERARSDRACSCTAAACVASRAACAAAAPAAACCWAASASAASASAASCPARAAAASAAHHASVTNQSKHQHKNEAPWVVASQTCNHGRGMIRGGCPPHWQ
jgi:hypothetical protein